MDPGGQAEVHAYYGRDEERERLDAALGMVEFERTKEIMVHHRDLVPLHVEHARRDAAAANVEIDSREGDAQAVDLPDASVDAVLLLGPLHHLPQAVDRIAALREAGRIVRACGFVFLAAISRWPACLHGVLVERVHEKFPEVLELLGEVERSRRLPLLHEGSFAGYTHRPRELRTEARAAGLDPLDLVGVEGLAFAVPDLETLLETGLGRQIVFDAARAFERVPELLGLGPDLILTAQCRA